MTKIVVYPGTELEMFSKAVNWKKYLSSFIKPHIRGKVLEAGAGLGFTTGWLKHGHEQEWVLLEPDPGMAALLTQKVNRDPAWTHCSVLNGTIGDIAPGRFFDTIIYIDVLEHIQDDKEEIRMAANRLNAGGKLIILSPAYQFLFSPFDKAIGHFRRYSRKRLTSVAGAFLEIESIRYLDTAGLLSSLGNKLILKQQYPTQRQVAFWDKFFVPVSRILDKFFFYSFGKSILGIWIRTSD